MSEQDEIRKTVSESYAKAVTGDSDCGSCCGDAIPKGVTAKIAGYTRDDLDALPEEAVVNSFGCGNPLAFSEVKEGDVVLDLGSGAGIDILIAGKKVGPTGRAIGIDMTDDMIAKARENIAASGLENVEVRKGIIEELPVDDASVDWVISNCVINLSPEKGKVFSEIARVLKPGGKILISDIVVTDLPEWVRQNESLYCSCVSGAISEEEYVGGLEKAGIEGVEVRERLHYDAVQMKAFIGSEIDQAISDESACCPGQDCCGTSADTDLVEQTAEFMTGRIWSAKFYGCKSNG